MRKLIPIELMIQLGFNEKKKQMLESKEKTKEKRDKIDNYAKYVREMYWPKVSVKK